MSKLSIKGILEKLDKLKKSNPHRYMINGSKNCRILTPWSGPLAMGQKKQHCNNFYRLVFIRLTLFFQAQFGLISRIIVLREFISVFHKETEKKKTLCHFSHYTFQFPADLVTFTEEIHNGKLHFFVLCHGNGCKEENMLHQ